MQNFQRIVIAMLQRECRANAMTAGAGQNSDQRTVSASECKNGRRRAFGSLAGRPLRSHTQRAMASRQRRRWVGFAQRVATITTRLPIKQYYVVHFAQQGTPPLLVSKYTCRQVAQLRAQLPPLKSRDRCSGVMPRFGL